MTNSLWNNAECQKNCVAIEQVKKESRYNVTDPQWLHKICWHELPLASISHCSFLTKKGWSWEMNLAPEPFIVTEFVYLKEEMCELSQMLHAVAVFFTQDFPRKQWVI